MGSAVRWRLVSGSDSGSVEEGKLIVPWSSTIARPEGVCRRFGSGFEGEMVLLEEGGWRGMEGIA